MNPGGGASSGLAGADFFSLPGEGGGAALRSLEYSPLSILSVQASTWLTKLSRALTKSW